jgi:hypothetical protein
MNQVFRNKDILILTVTSALIVVCLLGFLSLNNSKPLRDELNFNMPTALNFYQNSIPDAMSGEGYTSGTTPLPFILLKLMTLGSYPDIIIYRIISFLFSISAVVLLMIFLNKYVPQKEAVFISLLMLYQPYFLKSSLTFYTASFGLLFLILFLLLYFKNDPSKLNSLFMGMASAAAILCQQIYIALPMVYTIFLFLNHSSLKKPIKPVHHFLFYLPHIFPALLFITWGGLTHDQPRDEIINGSASIMEFICNVIPFKNFTAVLTICGFYIFPASVYFIRKIKWRYLLIFLIISILLAAFNTPVFTNSPQYNHVTGLVHRLICYASFYLHPVAGEILRVSCLTSLFVFVFLLFNEAGSKNSGYLNILIITFIILFCFDILLSERHLIPLIVLLFVTLSGFKISAFYYYCWIFMMLLLGGGYSLHWFNYY